MNFLELCQFVGRESSVISGNGPSTVVGQTGKLAKIVYWTADAWKDIQMMRPNWNWKRAEITAQTLSIGVSAYAGSDLGVVSRFDRFMKDEIRDDGDIYRPWTIYDSTIGVSDEGILKEISWLDFRTKYKRGTQSPTKPIHYAISPDGKINFGPAPDTGNYKVSGEYWKSNQDLSVVVAPLTTADTNTPEMPTDFHRAIGWKAVQLLVRHDEAPADVMATAEREFRAIMAPLMTSQLPEITVGGAPIA